MNPIGILCLAISSGCAAGFVFLVNGLRVGQDAVHELADRDELDIDWKAIAADVSEELKDRQKVRSERVDTLRIRYLADLAAATEKLVEVPAR
jgi:hypothetical protein